MKRTKDGRRGSALIAAAVMITAVSVLSYSAMTITNSAVREQIARRHDLQARLAADAGLAVAVAALNAHGSAALGDLMKPTEFGGATYQLEVAEDASGLITLVAVGESGTGRSRLQLVLKDVSRSKWQFGAFGDQGLTMDSNAHVDSYDSRLGLYTDQDDFRRMSMVYARTNGAVGSNRSVSLRSNATVHGEARPGPGYAVSLADNAWTSGARTPAAEVVSLEPVSLPASPGDGGILVEGSRALDLGGGTVTASFLETASNSKLLVTGPGKVVLNDISLGSKTQLLFDTSGGPVELYVARSLVMHSNAEMRGLDYDPAKVSLMLTGGASLELSDPDTGLFLDSNTKFYGTIYAPTGEVRLESNVEVFGSIMAGRVHLDANSRVHFDEALTEVITKDDWSFEVIGWRVLPRRSGAELSGRDPVGVELTVDDVPVVESY